MTIAPNGVDFVRGCLRVYSSIGYECWVSPRRSWDAYVDVRVHRDSDTLLHAADVLYGLRYGLMSGSWVRVDFWIPGRNMAPVVLCVGPSDWCINLLRLQTDPENQASLPPWRWPKDPGDLLSLIPAGCIAHDTT